MLYYILFKNTNNKFIKNINLLFLKTSTYYYLRTIKIYLLDFAVVCLFHIPCLSFVYGNFYHMEIKLKVNNISIQIS